MTRDNMAEMIQTAWDELEGALREVFFERFGNRQRLMDAINGLYIAYCQRDKTMAQSTFFLDEQPAVLAFIESLGYGVKVEGGRVSISHPKASFVLSIQRTKDVFDDILSSTSQPSLSCPHIQFLGEENIEEVEKFLGDRLLEKIVDSSKGSLLTDITLRTPDGEKTVPVGAYLVRNPTGTVTPYLEVTDVKKIGEAYVVPM